MFKRKELGISEEIRQKLLFRIRPIIAKQLRVSEEGIVPNAKIRDDLGIDSLNSIELIMALEEEFAIEIIDSDAEKMVTINDIIVYLVQRVKL